MGMRDSSAGGQLARMPYQYWVATVDIPRGHHRALRLPQGQRISRLIEWKVNIDPHNPCFICTVVIEETLEAAEEPQAPSPA
jgi:hypothetical protein